MKGMGNVDVLLPLVLPQTMPCPKSVARDTLKAIALDFCKRSGAWEERHSGLVCACDCAVYPRVPQSAAIDDIFSFKINGEKFSGYEISGREIILRETGHAGEAEIGMILRPLRDSGELPNDILDEFGDIIACGAVAKLKSMSGDNVEWTDLAVAQTNLQLYLEGCAAAKSRKCRKRFGYGILYVNMEG